MNQAIDGVLFKKMMINGANHLENHKKIVDDLNVFPVPDGDTGTNMSMTINAAARELLAKDDPSISVMADVVAGASLRGARGNSGVILSQLFRGFLRGLDHAETVGTIELAAALESATATAYKAVMKPTEGTILTVARLTSAYAAQIAPETEDMIDFAEKVLEKAKEALDLTPTLLPVLKQAGVVDSGGKGLVVILEGALAALKGETIELEQAPQTSESAPQAEIDLENIKFQYCTEFIIEKHSANYSVTPFKSAIERKGDSMLVIDDNAIVKVHIHTNHPGFVLEEAVKIGSLSDIKIDNMKLQHRETLVPKQPEEPQKECGIVAVVSGDGLAQVFTDAGVDKIVRGGQSMNPSTEDILEAVKQVNAKTVFILPNNKNIILAAEQVNGLAGQTTVVIPTKTVPQGISAALAFDPNASMEENKEAMSEPLSIVKTGSVTFAARDSEIDGMQIKKDDIMGMLEGKIVCIGSDPHEIAKQLLSDMVDDETSIISVFYGEDVSDEQAKTLEDAIAQTHSSCDVMVCSGGQPLYYYILSAE